MSSYLKNVAIVGAAGAVGHFITDELLKAGKHQITAVTRADSASKMPDGVRVAKVDYDDPATLVEALRVQDILVITMSASAPQEIQEKLVDAAVEAGVRWILPNEWGGDYTNPELVKDTFLGPGRLAVQKYIVDTGKCSWIGVACGFWYEYSLGGSENRYGFDFNQKKLTLYDGGNARINTSTWPQVGRAVARLLALPEGPSTDGGLTLSSYRNNYVRISSFCLNQKNMFDSVLRVTGDKPEAWTVTHEPVKERYQRGVGMMQEGSLLGFLIALYARVFYPVGDGSYGSGAMERTGKLDNEKLGLPVEDLDEYTGIGISRRHLQY